MNDMVLKKAIAEALCEEYIASIPSYDSDHVFSDSFNRKMDKLIARRRKAYYPMIKTAGRRVAAGLVAAAIMGTVTAAAYEPVRTFFKEFFVERFFGHDSVKTVNTDSEIVRERIEKKYTVDIPKKYSEWKTYNYESDNYTQISYTSDDNMEDITFTQTVKSAFVMETDNEQSELENKKDKYGRNILISNYEDTDVLIIWEYDGYVFTLSGVMSEDDLMDIYYTFRVV